MTEFLKDIPQTINAAFAVVVHSSFDAPSIFATVLSSKIELKVQEAANGTKISAGNVYICKPDFHLFVEDDTLHLSKGPRENLFRPAIDVLFRSAAIAYQNRCVGILLTGRLNDGTAGLEAIKKCGGLAIIQNPATAEFKDMPANAKRLVDVDYVVNLEDMAEVIQRTMAEQLPEAVEIPKSLILENEMAVKFKSQIGTDEKIGYQVPISCPSCGGPLWKMEKSGINRYRCHVGHAFSQEALLKSQNESLEEVLWIAMRTLEEKKMLLERMVSEYSQGGLKKLSTSYADKISEVSQHIAKLRPYYNFKINCKHEKRNYESKRFICCRCGRVRRRP